MKHLPFNHNYRPLRCWNGEQYDDHLAFSKTHKVTNLTLLCRCGHIKTTQIANFTMTQSEIDTFLSTVYPER